MRPTSTRAFGRIRDEEETLPVKKLMPESSPNYRFRGTTLTCWLITALENIIHDTVMIAPVLKPTKPESSSPTDVGMAAKDDHDETNYDRRAANRRHRSANSVHRCRTRRELVHGQRSELELELEEEQPNGQRWQGYASCSNELLAEGWT